MSFAPEENPMVWVAVQTLDDAEQYVGQHNPDQDIMFIPFFQEKEDAQYGLSLMARKKGGRYDVQAIRFRELAQDAARQGFLLFRTDGEGQILDKIDPNTVG
jgi:hypothetical protein